MSYLVHSESLSASPPALVSTTEVRGVNRSKWRKKRANLYQGSSGVYPTQVKLPLIVLCAQVERLRVSLEDFVGVNLHIRVEILQFQNVDPDHGE